MRRLLAIVTGLAAVLCADLAMAQEVPAPARFEIKGGILAHDIPGLWSGFNLEKGFDFNVEMLFGRGLPFLGGYIRPAVGASINSQGYTSKAYVDARWEIDMPYRTFLGLGLGAAVHDGRLDPSLPDYKALGSRVLFHVPVELGLRLGERQSISVYFEHMSNGNTARYNEALDNIGLRYGVRF